MKKIARKKKTSTPKPVLRSTRLTSPRGVANDGKFDLVLKVFDRVMSLKNAMSAACHRDLESLFRDPAAFLARYKDPGFQGPDLNAWETQALFQDIAGHYREDIQRRFRHSHFRVQAGWTVERYGRDVTVGDGRGGKVVVHRKGDIRSFVLVTRRSDLALAAQYLLHVADPASLDPTKVRDAALRAVLERVWGKPAIRDRLVSLVVSRQKRLIGRVKLNHHTSGSHRRDPRISHSGVVEDASNGRYRWFYRFRLGNGARGQEKAFVHLPLLFQPGRQRPGDLRLDAIHVLYVRKGRKFMVGCTHEAVAPVFPPPDAPRVWEGADANTKHNLLVLSDGTAYDYDRAWISRLLSLLGKIERKPGVPDFRGRARIAKLCRANEAALRRYVAEILDGLVARGVTDLCLEDLDFRGGATFLRHPDLEVKYSRLLRLLRLSGLKGWIGSQAEKRGIRVHLTAAAYTSQKCPACHAIDRANRPTQEEFACIECGFSAPADWVAALNVRESVARDVPDALEFHVLDPWGRASPRPVKRSDLKLRLAALPGLPAPVPPPMVKRRPGGVTELLTPG